MTEPAALLQQRSTILAISNPADNTRCGLEIWRSGALQSPVEEFIAPEVECPCYEALAGWHLGETSVGQATMAEAIARAKELNDLAAFGLALYWAGFIAIFAGNPH